MINLVIIPSVIKPVDRPLSYCPIRSVFSPKERFQQTIIQIQSVRTKIPDSYIVMVEASSIPTDMENILTNMVDHYINVSDVSEVAEPTNGIAKGHGEVMQLLYYLRSNHFKSIRHNCVTVSKFGGRIKLSDDFVFSVPTTPRIGLSKIRVMFTCLYTMPNHDIDGYIRALEECLTEPGFIAGQLAVEEVLYEKWFGGKPFEYANPVGFEGYCAINGVYSKV
jgi:hypothetical protein